MTTDDVTRLEVHEPGFDGTVTIEQGTVRITGTRPQDGAAVVKDVPADRDPELARLVELAVGGDSAVAGRLVAHVGVTDPV